MFACLIAACVGVKLLRLDCVCEVSETLRGSDRWSHLQAWCAAGRRGGGKPTKTSSSMSDVPACGTVFPRKWTRKIRGVDSRLHPLTQQQLPGVSAPSEWTARTLCHTHPHGGVLRPHPQLRMGVTWAAAAAAAAAISQTKPKYYSQTKKPRQPIRGAAASWFSSLWPVCSHVRHAGERGFNVLPMSYAQQWLLYSKPVSSALRSQAPSRNAQAIRFCLNIYNNGEVIIQTRG